MVQHSNYYCVCTIFVFYLRNILKIFTTNTIMIVDEALVDKLANLSKLEFDADGKKAIQQDLAKILNFMEKLNELDTDGIEPLIYINEDENVFRKDEVNYPITKEEALMNAPLKNEDYFMVPKFVTGTKY